MAKKIDQGSWLNCMLISWSRQFSDHSSQCVSSPLRWKQTLSHISGLFQAAVCQVNFCLPAVCRSVSPSPAASLFPILSWGFGSPYCQAQKLSSVFFLALWALAPVGKHERPLCQHTHDYMDAGQGVLFPSPFNSPPCRMNSVKEGTRFLLACWIHFTSFLASLMVSIGELKLILKKNKQNNQQLTPLTNIILLVSSIETSSPQSEWSSGNCTSSRVFTFPLLLSPADQWLFYFSQLLYFSLVGLRWSPLLMMVALQPWLLLHKRWGDGLTQTVFWRIHSRWHNNP